MSYYNETGSSEYVARGRNSLNFSPIINSLPVPKSPKLVNTTYSTGFYPILDIYIKPYNPSKRSPPPSRSIRYKNIEVI
jgi:hypothetical protein